MSAGDLPYGHRRALSTPSESCSVHPDRPGAPVLSDAADPGSRVAARACSDECRAVLDAARHSRTRLLTPVRARNAARRARQDAAMARAGL